MQTALGALSLTAAALAVPLAPVAAQQPRPIRGFPTDALAAEHAREAQLRAVPSRDSLRALLRRLSENPHEAGTDRSLHVAQAIQAQLRSYGLDARIERFEALLPRPISRTLELTAPERFTATLKEPAIPEDKDSNDPDQLPTYNAYSADGDVTAPVVFVNYGLPEDYKVLDSLGISVKGKIVIAKYGRSWRGIKPKVAAEHGAVGCIIYSDPKDDGYYVDDVYPKGPMRPWEGVQRGSVMDMPVYPGDPLSPGWAAEAGSKRLARAESKVLMKIPVLPISYQDALPFLRNLGGPVAPEAWRGALPITYHLGGGAAVAHLALKFDWREHAPLYDVITRIPGATAPDEWVILGNHHDAWVNGAEDPLSGQVALMEMARGLAGLLRSGWRPARTIILAAWDGEEPGLLGSTEWAEKHQAELRDKAVAYMNSDTNDEGWLGVAGSHSLQTFMAQVARDVPDPKGKGSVLDASLARRREAAERAAARQGPQGPQPAAKDSLNLTPADRARLQADSARYALLTRAGVDTAWSIGALGSGSDYTAFLDHVGVPSLNIEYGGAHHAGIYHSIYDSFDFYTRFLDTSFAYGVTEARTTGTAALRLADAPLLPFEFGTVARTYRRYVDEIEREARKDSATRALDLSGVRQALDRLDDAAARYEAAAARAETTPTAVLRARRAQLARVNKLLYQSERQLTDSAGLPGREWFRHLIYAPGFYTGYGVKTMPGIREAVEDVPNGAVAQQQAARVAAAVDRMAAQVGRAAEELDRALH